MTDQNDDPFQGNESERQRWLNGDQTLGKKFEDFYRNKFGTAEVSEEPPTPNDKLSPELERLKSEWEASQHGQAAEPADAASADALTAALRQDPEFGSGYDENLEAARQAHLEIFGARAEEVAAQVDASFSEAEKVAAIKLLAKLRK